MSDPTFPETLAAARMGAEWAWASIYRELAPPLLGYVRGRGAGDPEDVLGEVFLQVVRDLGRFEGGERDFRAWVFAVAHHRLLDERRRSSRRPVVLTPHHDLGDATSPASDVESLERLEHDEVRRIIGRLPADQRDVLLLRLLGDLTVEQTAGVIGRSPGAVKALQRRGLESIQRAVAKGGVTL